jgi:hypothetical protein
MIKPQLLDGWSLANTFNAYSAQTRSSLFARCSRIRALWLVLQLPLMRTKRLRIFTGSVGRPSTHKSIRTTSKPSPDTESSVFTRSCGSLTSGPAEVIAGNESIKGSYSASASYTLYLQTNPSVLSLAPNHSYMITFQYKILTAPGNGFFVGFYSPTAGAQGNFLPGTVISGSAGATAMLTSTLGNYSDYVAIWNITSTLD